MQVRGASRFIGGLNGYRLRYHVKETGRGPFHAGDQAKVGFFYMSPKPVPV